MRKASYMFSDRMSHETVIVFDDNGDLDYAVIPHQLINAIAMIYFSVNLDGQRVQIVKIENDTITSRKVN